MEYQADKLKALIKEEKGFKFIEEGKGESLILLHGLFGALSNYRYVLDHFSKNYKVVIPLLPIYELSLSNSSVKGLVQFLNKFINYKAYKDFILIGNSLGGHVALVYALKHPEQVKAISLTGSSGLYENTMGGTYPRRSDRNFIKEKVEFTFYDPGTSSEDLVDEVYEAVNNRQKVARIIMMSRSAMKHNLSDELPNVKVPVSLIWGKNDNITPLHVAEEFKKLIPNSELSVIDKCGHAAMMERPIEFNVVLEKYLNKLLNNNSMGM